MNTPAIDRAESVLAAGPLPRIDLARRIGPHGSLRYGYEAISRGLKAGRLVLLPPLPDRRGLTVGLPE